MPRRSNRLILLIISSTFLLPLIAVWLMLKGSLGLNPGSSPRFGYPLEPPAFVAWSDQAAQMLRGRWSVLFMATDPCESSCRKTISGLRLTYQETAHHASRLQFAVWLPANSDGLQFKELFPEASLLRPDERSEKDQMDAEGQLSAVLQQSTAAGAIFILDPASRITMYYSAETDFRFVRHDLVRFHLPADQAD